MITAVVQFKLTEGTSLEDATVIFQSTAPRYLGMAGLARKYYLFDPDTGKGGGCYLFESRADAEAIFNDAWRALIKDKYGAEPDIQYFETPVVVDNLNDEIFGGSNIAAE
jgi:hypothetical protein